MSWVSFQLVLALLDEMCYLKISTNQSRSEIRHVGEGVFFFCWSKNSSNNFLLRLGVGLSPRESKASHPLPSWPHPTQTLLQLSLAARRNKADTKRAKIPIFYRRLHKKSLRWPYTFMISFCSENCGFSVDCFKNEIVLFKYQRMEHQVLCV